jgi:hypothetical protein
MRVAVLPPFLARGTSDPLAHGRTQEIGFWGQTSIILDPDLDACLGAASLAVYP